MNNKQTKKIRKIMRKKCDEISKSSTGKALFKIARQRDFIFLAAIIEFVVIIVLGLVVLL